MVPLVVPSPRMERIPARLVPRELGRPTSRCPSFCRGMIFLWFRLICSEDPDVYAQISPNFAALPDIHFFPWKSLPSNENVIKHVSTRWLSLNKCLIRLLDNWEPLLSFVKTERNDKSSRKQYTFLDSPVHETDDPKSTTSSSATKSAASSSATKSTASSTATKSTPSNSAAKSAASSSAAKSAPSKSAAKSAASSSAAKSTPRSSAAKSPASSSAAKSATSSSAARSTPSSNARLERMYSFLKSPTKKLYLLFLTSTLPVFEQVNIELQSEKPMIHIVRRILLKLLRLLFLRFLRPVALHGVPVLDVQFHLPYHHKLDEDLLIGEEARKYIAGGDKVGLRHCKVTDFYADTKAFFVAACTYLKKKLPFQDEVLIHAEITDTGLQLDSRSSSLHYLLKRFPCLLPLGASGEDLLLEFATFQATDITGCKKERLDETWKAIGELNDENGTVLLKFLPSFMLSVLTIPHSSAHCERVFSCVRKNRTDQCASLGEVTLDALLVVKSDVSPVWKRTFSDELLRRLKSCYTQSLKQQDSSSN